MTEEIYERKYLIWGSQFQKARVHNGGNGMACWQEKEASWLHLICTKEADRKPWKWASDEVDLPSMGRIDENESGLSTKPFATSTFKWQKSGKHLKSLLTHATAIS